MLTDPLTANVFRTHELKAHRVPLNRFVLALTGEYARAVVNQNVVRMLDGTGLTVYLSETVLPRCLRPGIHFIPVQLVESVCLFDRPPAVTGILRVVRSS